MIKKIVSVLFSKSGYATMPIPKKIADKLEIKRGDSFEWILKDGELNIKHIKL